MTDLFKSFSALVIVSLSLTACSFNNFSLDKITSSQEAALRPLDQEERTQDFDALVIAIREYYGPLQYKENRFGYTLDQLVQEYRPLALAAKSDAEATGVIKMFLSRLQDGHVSMAGQLDSVQNYSVPVLLTPVQDRALVAMVMDPGFSEDTGIEVGDEVLEVDGQPTMSYLSIIKKYEAMGNALSDKYWIMKLLNRPSYITELTPKKSSVALKIAKQDGSVVEKTVVWKKGANEKLLPSSYVLGNAFDTSYSSAANELIQADLSKFGAETPFFMTPQAMAALKFVQVNPSETYLKKFGMTDLSKNPKLFAGFYRHEGQNILFIRQATYGVKDPDERIIWYKALLAEYGPLADKLVLDQTHNPGGSLGYALDFARLFAKGDSRSLVNFLHADRKWLSSLAMISKMTEITGQSKRSIELTSKLVESAYDKGLHMTETAINLGFWDYIPQADVTFDGPILLLVDELAGSCGDIFPSLMKTNKLATLFGERTIGLGGNVEQVVTLPSSQISVNLTRGLFFVYSPTGEYDMKNAVENNGVTPDIHYQHTVKDVRAGYVDYVKAFSKAAVELK
jgi:Periplasmic protease